MAKVFISYLHADEELRNELEKHLAALRHQGVITVWHDRRIEPGKELHVKQKVPGLAEVFSAIAVSMRNNSIK